MKQPNQTRPAPMKVLNRVLRYMLHYYALPFALVICCILVAAVATVTGSTFPQTLVDDYIVPILNSGSADFSQLAASLVRLACILALGVLASYGYNRIMVTISQGTMRRLRDDLFHRMESLPISYFDTHAHGDIMSVYTNDIDTLRQLLSQSIPQIINTTVTMAATLVAMLVLNPALTVISVLTACVMVLVTTSFTRLSGKYYIRQQHDLGVVDGFIEEMLDGQKVVKVFCHEDAALRDFRAVNDRLRDSANMANRYSNLLMPINANIGWLSYVLVAIVGAVLGINGLAGVTLGTVISFLSLNKSFTNPITQISMQINFVVTAAAGAQRVFDLMDQTPETDDGYVELVNAREDADGFIRRLPDGYNTMLTGDGANLSQGQRQLLAIARAAVADPPVMIMDEATSSIDTRTEAIVQRGMDALMTGRTVFVIAHRLSTVQNANAIMVLDHGRIIERGTHDDLIKLHGTYYQLYTGALELD